MRPPRGPGFGPDPMPLHALETDNAVAGRRPAPRTAVCVQLGSKTFTNAARIHVSKVCTDNHDIWNPPALGDAAARSTRYRSTSLAPTTHPSSKCQPPAARRTADEYASVITTAGLPPACVIYHVLPHLLARTIRPSTLTVHTSRVTGLLGYSALKGRTGHIRPRAGRQGDEWPQGAGG
ncbi:hypothetical protein BD413DRAFT_110377 [Trametes elegans]|nr:hypothetical protein BD413DRAFT_110377 [Trametes elegans]